MSSHDFGKGKVLFKTKGFDEAERNHNAKTKALHKKMGKKDRWFKGKYPTMGEVMAREYDSGMRGGLSEPKKK